MAYIKHSAFAALLVAASTGCNASDEYILYRTAVTPGVGPIEIARFVADDMEGYNKENCLLTKQLFRQYNDQQQTRVEYWCEEL